MKDRLFLDVFLFVYV